MFMGDRASRFGKKRVVRARRKINGLASDSVSIVGSFMADTEPLASAGKVCSACRGKPKPLAAFYKQVRGLYGRMAMCIVCYRKRFPPAYFRKNAAKHKKRSKRVRRAWDERLRRKVIRHYGSRCICCGERMIELLQVVLEGDFGVSPKALYYRLTQEGFPAGPAVWCFNCSMSMKEHGYCPHNDNVV
jgi:hypothetical protein